MSLNVELADTGIPNGHVLCMFADMYSRPTGSSGTAQFPFGFAIITHKIPLMRSLVFVNEQVGHVKFSLEVQVP